MPLTAGKDNVRPPVLFLSLLALMAAEIAGFVLVGRQIGALATVGLVFLSMIVGAWLLRVQGFGILARVQQEMDRGRPPARELAHGAMILMAAMLLIIPGFLTDIAGLLLFIPPVRDLAWTFVKTRISIVARFNRTAGAGQRSSRTIDLDTDEYSRTGGDDSPWRRIDRE